MKKVKVTPVKKQSKSAQRKINAARRGSWNGISPVTRVVKSRKVYDRNRAKRDARKESEE